MIRKFKKVITHNCGEETIPALKKRGVKIGENVHIYSSEIDGGHGFLVEIGNDVTITNSTILTHDASTKKFLGYSKVGKVKIGNNVFVGYGSIILPGVTIGNNVIIGAGTVVRKDIPEGSVVIGNPAQIVCGIDTYLFKNQEKMKKLPIYKTYWKNKTVEEIEKMKVELENSMGFDI